MTEDFPKFARTIATYASNGVNWALKNVLPSVVSTLVENIPTIITGIGTGIVDGVNNLLHGKSNDGKMADLENATNLITDNYDAMISNNDVPSWYDETLVAKQETVNKTNKVTGGSGGTFGSTTNTTETQEEKGILNSLVNGYSGENKSNSSKFSGAGGKFGDSGAVSRDSI